MPLFIFLAVIAVGAIITFSGNAVGAEVNYDNSDVTPNIQDVPDASTEQDQPQGFIDMIYPDTLHPLLKLIQKRESGGRYDVVFGGRTFQDFSTHPYAGWKRDAPQPIGKGQFARENIRPATITVGKNAGDVSTAAGKYQCVLNTWKSAADQLGRWDFTPATQDAIAYQICVSIGATAAYDRGDFEGAIRKCATQWTSLPTSTTGEAATTMQVALRELQSYS
jgi:muramidase (phage lysozyme)